MGLYDRPYYQDDDTRSPFAPAGRTMIVNLIIVNAAIFVVDTFLLGDRVQLSKYFAVQSTTLMEPWNWYRLLTYGFLHSTQNAFHLIGNMLGLYFLGQEVERHYGGQRFLRMYLTSLVICSIVWSGTEALMGRQLGSLIGASGAVTAVVMLFALNFPRRTVLFMMFLPMPAWVLGVMIVVMNLFGVEPAAGGGHERIAYDVHLVGALYGFIFFRTRWAVGNWMEGRSSGRWPKLPRRKPKLKVHEPDTGYVELDGEADAVLEKLHREGQSSLTARERKVLEAYSRRMQQKHR